MSATGALRSTGGETVNVINEGSRICVQWACTGFRFSAPRLRELVRGVERFADSDVWLAFTTDNGYEILLQVRDGTLYASQRSTYPADDHAIEWAPLLAAMKQTSPTPEWE